MSTVSFSLVDYDGQGQPVRLPPRLGDLPLHPEQNGWYSVLGSWNGVTNNPNPPSHISQVNSENNLAVLIPAFNSPGNARSNLPSIFCEYPKCTGNRLAAPFVQCYAPTCIILTCTHNSFSGPHTCAPGRYTCEALNCSWSGTFKTKQAFNRHYCAMHDSDRVDCRVEGCVRVGAQGIKRADNLAVHMLNKHGISPSGISYEN